MKCCKINASFYLSGNLAGGTVSIFMGSKQVRQIVVPQISFKSMTDCHFQQFIDHLEQETFQVLCIIILIVIVIHKKCHVFQNLTIFHMFI